MDPVYIEMKTIHTNTDATSIVSPLYRYISAHITYENEWYKILMDTECVITKSPMLMESRDEYPFHELRTKNAIVLHHGHKCWGKMVNRKNIMYIDITEYYKTEYCNYTPGQHARCSIWPDLYYTSDVSIYIPVVFDMTGTHKLNICVYCDDTS